MTFTTKRSFTVPDRSPLFKPIPRFYKAFRKLSVYCEASEAGIGKALPQGLEPDGTTIEIFVMHCPEVYDVASPEMGPRNYLEGGVVVPARYKDLRGGHVLYEYVTTDDSMAGGREVWGYPKKIGDVTFEEDPSGAIRGTVSRLGRSLIDARFQPDDTQTFEKPMLHPRIQTKRIPRADGQGLDVDQIIRNDLKDSKLLHKVGGRATVSLGGSSIMDPIYELDVRTVIGAEFIIAEFMLDYGTIHEDRLKPAA